MKIYSAQHRAIVEAPIMEKPDPQLYLTVKDYEVAMLTYEKRLTSYPPIPVLREHQNLFKDGQEVKEGIDYRIERRNQFSPPTHEPLGNTGAKDASHGWLITEVAIPIKQQVSEEGGGYYFKLFKFFSDQHDLTLLDSEIQDIIHAVNEFQAQQVSEEDPPCSNCKETDLPCACMRNICTECKKPVGNITFTVCDECWEKYRVRPVSQQDKEPLPQQEVKNLPTKIYLQIGDDHWDDKKVDFKDLHEVSWCEDKINSNDIPYVLESQLSEALAKIKSQEAEIADLRKQLK